METTTDRLRNIEILNEYKECKVLQTVANKYGLSKQRVSQIIKRFGYKKPQTIYLTDKEKKEIKNKNKVAHFWDRVNKTENGCWELTGSKTPAGYGHIKFYGSWTYSHRVSWSLSFGEIPSGLCILHRCDNPSCVNPDHLFLGTMLDNMHDRDAKGRNNKGKKYPRKSKTSSCIS